MSQLTVDQVLQIARQHHQAGQLPQAEALYRQILQQHPNHPDALHLLGVIAYQAGQQDLAVDLIGRAIALKPNFPEAYGNLGNARRAQGQLDAAIAAYRQAIALNPKYAAAYNHLGVALYSKGQLDAAIAACRQAIALKPNYAEAYSNLGLALQDRGQLDEAIAACRQAIALNPCIPEAHTNLGLALQDRGQSDEAIAAHRQAITLRPGYAEAHSNLGNALQAQGQLDAALAAHHHAAALSPANAGIHSNLGNTLQAQGQLDSALAAYRQAVALGPGNAAIHSNLVYILHFHPGYDAQAIYQEACRWNNQHARPLAPPGQQWVNDRDPDRPLRIGYISPNFRKHTNGWAMLPLLQAHDHARHRIVCYSDVTSPDTMTDQSRNAADEWHSIVGLSDEHVAELVRKDRIDVLVDLVLHMAHNRLLVFARKPAPVQVTWLGYPGTTGLNTIDYRISDPHVDPPACCEGCYTEKTIYMPDCYLCFQAPPNSPAINMPPAFQNGYVTFGSMNNFAKVTPQVLELWSRLLAALPDSQLILRCPAGETQQRVLQVFARRGIASTRVSLHSEQFGALEYLQLHHRMDIYLDPFPYAGHTTSLDALWMGVPLITLAGQTAAARGGVFLLANLGLPELIAHDEQDYLDRALALARDLPRLKELRSTLRQRLQQSPLMDAPRFARNIEAAYRQMWRHWCATA